MADITVEKEIMIYEDGVAKWSVEPGDGEVLLIVDPDPINGGETISFSLGIIGPICKALHEVALNVAENYREDDGD